MKKMDNKMPDLVNHPPHYMGHKSGIECIRITEHMSFCLGNSFKYIYRAGLKGGGDKYMEDLRKAAWYLDREIKRFEEHKTILKWEKVEDGKKND